MTRTPGAPRHRGTGHRGTGRPGNGAPGDGAPGHRDAGGRPAAGSSRPRALIQAGNAPAGPKPTKPATARAASLNCVTMASEDPPARPARCPRPTGGARRASHRPTQVPARALSVHQLRLRPGPRPNPGRARTAENGQPELRHDGEREPARKSRPLPETHRGWSTRRHRPTRAPIQAGARVKSPIPARTAHPNGTSLNSCTVASHDARAVAGTTSARWPARHSHAAADAAIAPVGDRWPAIAAERVRRGGSPASRQRGRPPPVGHSAGVVRGVADRQGAGLAVEIEDDRALDDVDEFVFRMLECFPG